MKCLVTGAAGFIGSTLSERLLNDGCQVVGIDNFLDYYPRRIKEHNLTNALANSKYTFVEADILSADLESLLDGVETIFHQAGQAGVRASWGEYFKTYTDHNVLATQRLLEASKNSKSLKKFVNASSSSVYGDAEAYPTSEQALPLPVSPYGVTKLAAEKLVTLYATQFGLPTVSLRYFTVYGPRQRPDMAFHIFSRLALEGKPISIFGDGEQTRDFTFVDDIVQANLSAAEYGDQGNAYNIGGGTNASVNDVLKIFEKNVGNLDVSYKDKVLGEARCTSADTSRAEADLKFSPKVSLEQGIAAEIEWMRQFLEFEK